MIQIDSDRHNCCGEVEGLQDDRQMILDRQHLITDRMENCLKSGDRIIKLVQEQSV